MKAAARFYNERSCNDDYVPIARFYRERSCNDDYVPAISRSTCEPIKLEKKYYENANIRQYTDAIGFGTSTKGEFTFTRSLESDARLEAIDAKLEADYKTETIFMELNLSEPEEVEDFDLPYYHYQAINLFYSSDPMSDDEENEP